MTKFKLAAAAIAALASITAFAAEWTYDGTYMTTADGWKIQASKIGSTTNLATPDNGGMVKGVPSVTDDDGKLTLDLTGTITDKTDSTKTYTLTRIGYYAFNGNSGNIARLILPDTVNDWRLESQVGLVGRSAINDIEPKHFSFDVNFGLGNYTGFAIGNSCTLGELHLRGVTSTGNCSLTITHGGIQKIFFYDGFTSIGYATFANSGSTRYDLYFHGNAPSLSSIFNPGARALIHTPYGNASWETYIAGNCRAFGNNDISTFEGKFPGYPYPEYVVNAGEFNGAYLTTWFAEPGLTVTAPDPIAASQITPAYGTYSKKTGTEFVFSAPASIEENGVTYNCEGYTIETAGKTGWDSATTVTSSANSFVFTNDASKATRVTWNWRAQVLASVTVASNKGQFATVSSGYGTIIPTGETIFSATEPGYEEDTGTRYIVTGYNLTDKNGAITHHDGQSFTYTTDMGQITLEWIWAVNGYKLTTSHDNYLSCTVSPALDTHGYGSGSCTLTAVDDNTADGGEFYHWSGDITGIDSFSRSISVALDGPKTLVATPKCIWHFTSNGNYALTNRIGWAIKATAYTSTTISIGQDCTTRGAAVPWKKAVGTTPARHFLDLSLPIVRDSSGAEMTIVRSGNVPLRQANIYLAKLIMPTTWKTISFEGNGVFESQSYLSEITPAPFADDMNGGGNPAIGAIPYKGDLYLTAPCFTTIGNCFIKFTHGCTQNIYFGKQQLSIGTTGFSWSYANYRLWFQNFPTLASGRNGSGNYSFFVQYPGNNTQWSDYIAANARRFKASDRAGFTSRFPEDAAINNWPKYTFTNGFFNSTWAKPSPTGTTFIMK